MATKPRADKPGDTPDQHRVGLETSQLDRSKQLEAAVRTPVQGSPELRAPIAVLVHNPTTPSHSNPTENTVSIKKEHGDHVTAPGHPIKKKTDWEYSQAAI